MFGGAALRYVLSRYKIEDIDDPVYQSLHPNYEKWIKEKKEKKDYFDFEVGFEE